MTKNKLTAVVIALVGIEWIEFSLYLYLGVIFSKIFFPPESGQMGLILTYSIFALSYLSRPLGGLLLGLYSDCYGRTKPMVISCLVMGVATFGIGLMPGYANIGYAAPLLLLILRLLQGFSISGEFNNSAIFLIEHHKTYKIVAGSWVGMASSGGMFLGGFITYLVSSLGDTFVWRIAYVALGVISLLLVKVRRQLAESPEYLAFMTKQSQSNTIDSIVSALKRYWRNLLGIAALAAFMNVYIYTSNVYFIGFMVTHGLYALKTAALLISIIQGVTTLCIPLCALLAERICYKRAMIMAVIVMSLLVTPMLFYSVLNTYPKGVLIGLGLYMLANSWISAIVFYCMYNMLPVRIRCSGTSFSWGISAAIFGGTAPVLASLAINHGLTYMPSLYVFIFGLLAGYVVWRSVNVS